MSVYVSSSVYACCNALSEADVCCVLLAVKCCALMYLECLGTQGNKGSVKSNIWLEKWQKHCWNSGAETVAKEWLKQWQKDGWNSGKNGWNSGGRTAETEAEEWLKQWRKNGWKCGWTWLSASLGLRTAAELSGMCFPHTTCWVCRWCSRLTVLDKDNKCCALSSDTWASETFKSRTDSLVRQLYSVLWYPAWFAQNKIQSDCLRLLRWSTCTPTVTCRLRHDAVMTCTVVTRFCTLCTGAGVCVIWRCPSVCQSVGHPSVILQKQKRPSKRSDWRTQNLTMMLGLAGKQTVGKSCATR